ncbi:hypothetical protein [Arthrobacter sp. B0490]|uniref:hypothetical protein n=1 Tax=Arthrobacter sp. B0490 TaxID=2058891 RepID=UPI0021571AC6|nr:hypothetical protein [Arthrobacter sp. B0490]
MPHDGGSAVGGESFRKRILHLSEDSMPACSSRSRSPTPPGSSRSIRATWCVPSRRRTGSPPALRHRTPSGPRPAAPALGGLPASDAAVRAGRTRRHSPRRESGVRRRSAARTPTLAIRPFVVDRVSGWSPGWSDRSTASGRP